MNLQFFFLLILALIIALVHGSLIALIAKVSPVKFFKKISEALVVAFTTRSSYGTLAVTIRVLTEKVKISDRIASFTPLSEHL